MAYALVDSGYQKKLERFGGVLLERPCAQALWKPQLPKTEWEKADATFSRDKGKGWLGSLPKQWILEYEGLKFELAPTDFGHLGIFPEHKALWSWGEELLGPGKKVLNLFAYSGGATLAFARSGAEVCHLDASKGMVDWARKNAQLSELEKKPIRWVVDDATKFLKREVKRGRRYDAILLDPPSFGRGAKQEVFKIERDLPELLSLCKQLLTEDPLFVACSCHTNTITPTVLGHLLSDHFRGHIETGELFLRGEGRPVPTGSYARWRP